jgi:EAL domain-containing protein (putative c-di-GMP-specific phosphodiesterase class I)
MQVIAEGVETASQRDLLRGMGCHFMQGFLYSKAQPADAWTTSEAPPLPA